MAKGSRRKRHEAGDGHVSPAPAPAPAAASGDIVFPAHSDELSCVELTVGVGPGHEPPCRTPDPGHDPATRM
eukprot:COSAG02_NODE_66367_length_255_cov_1.083333_1_plen_71_part_10